MSRHNKMTERHDITQKLIDFVREFPCLYDVKHPHYKDSTRKAELWEQIGKEIKENGDVAKVKWKSLRDNYGRYKKEVELCVQSKKFDKWAWAEQLSFLDGVVSTKEPKKQAQAEKPQNNTPVDDGESLLESVEGSLREEFFFERSSASTPNRPSSDSEDQPLAKRPKMEGQQLDAADHLFRSYAETFKGFSKRNQIALKLELAQMFADIEAKEVIEFKQI